MFQSRGALPLNLYPVDSAVPAFPYGYQQQQVPSLHNGIAAGTENQFPVNSLNAALRRNPNLQLPPMDGFGEANPEVIEQKNLANFLLLKMVYLYLISKPNYELVFQVSAFWDDDLQSVVQMGFGQNKQPSFHGKVLSLKSYGYSH